MKDGVSEVDIASSLSVINQIQRWLPAGNVTGFDSLATSDAYIKLSLLEYFLTKDLLKDLE